MTYELYDTDSGNRLAVFRTVEGARRYVLTIVRRQGRQALEGLALGQFDAKTQRTRRLASGRRLAGWAAGPKVAAPARATTSPRRPTSRPKQLA